MRRRKILSYYRDRVDSSKNILFELTFLILNIIEDKLDKLLDPETCARNSNNLPELAHKYTFSGDTDKNGKNVPK